MSPYRRIANGISLVLEMTTKDQPLIRYAINRIMQYAEPDGSEVRNEL